jgi:ribulose-bisphosphate carboxylase small chain
MRMTQGTFSYLPDLTDDEIESQVEYCLRNGWAVNIEFSDDPHPRNVYWDLHGLPAFDATDTAGIMANINECRRDHKDCYVRVNGYDRSYGRQTTAISFIVQRPDPEPTFRLGRVESADRQVRYSLETIPATRAGG